MVVGDLVDLWSSWDQMNRNNAFGLVENLSDWYLVGNRTRPVRWPALVLLTLDFDFIKFYTSYLWNLLTKPLF